MTHANPGNPEAPQTELPRRDWILLPVIGLLTVILLAGSTIFAASRLNPTSEINLDHCFARAVPGTAEHTIPNSACSERIVESKYVAEYKFNSCGHRAGMECGPKPPGVYRIVMIGSSMAMGLVVPREMTFAALLPAELSEQTGRTVELYNEASGGEFRGGTYPTPTSPQHFGEVLLASPDMILWIITPRDIETLSYDNHPKLLTVSAAHEPYLRGSPAIGWGTIEATLTSGTILKRLRTHWDDTAAAQMMKHILYQSESQDQYVKSYLKNEDVAGYLKAEPNAKWQRALNAFQLCAAQMEQQANAAGVPLVAVLVPDRGQAAMISMGEWPEGYDPYKLGNELRETIEKNGGIYIDILPDFRTVPDPERLYFPVNGHPNADAHAMISRFLASQLTNGTVPALKVTTGQHTAVARGN